MILIKPMLQPDLNCRYSPVTPPLCSIHSQEAKVSLNLASGVTAILDYSPDTDPPAPPFVSFTADLADLVPGVSLQSP